MLSYLLNFIINTIINTISFMGPAGVFLLMTLESCGFPIPSEIVMPFAGFLVAKGQMLFWEIIFLGTLGNLAGSLIAYYIGEKGGRPLLEKYGKYILISHREIDKADRWFLKYGDLTVFFGRLLPVIKTYVSFPAGIAKMNVKKFSFYTVAGSLPWNILFAWLGIKMGEHWTVIQKQLHNLDLIILLILLIIIAWYFVKKKNKKNPIFRVSLK